MGVFLGFPLERIARSLVQAQEHIQGAIGLTVALVQFLTALGQKLAQISRRGIHPAAHGLDVAGDPADQLCRSLGLPGDLIGDHFKTTAQFPHVDCLDLGIQRDELIHESDSLYLAEKVLDSGNGSRDFLHAGHRQYGKLGGAFQPFQQGGDGLPRGIDGALYRGALAGSLAVQQCGGFRDGFPCAGGNPGEVPANAHHRVLHLPAGLLQLPADYRKNGEALADARAAKSRPDHPRERISKESHAPRPGFPRTSDKPAVRSQS